MSRTNDGLVVRRILAFLADAVVLVCALFAVTGRLVRSRGRRLAATAALTAVVGLPYHIVLEGAFGRTVGKRAFGIAVVSADGGDCTYAAATIRTLFRFVDWLPAGYLLAFVAMAVTDGRRRLGDVAAGTLVVRDE
ncbi:RDD family protein [Halopelagius fulvigenes]|uniref:RDD family protein n=1 Tax=Halopelagius fulvigenes TaxID=1198324 RepID=A0ABD5TZW6_9EURY